MSQRKLTEVLAALSSEQMELLSDFVRSPYFNKNVPYTGLFEYLKSLHPDYPKSEVSNETILKQVKGIEGENDLAIKMTRLLNMVGRFLSMEYNHDPILEQIGTLRAYKKLHLNRHFESLGNQLRKELKDEPFHDFDHLWRVHRLEEECFEGFKQGLLRTPENTLDKVFESLTRFYLTKKLCYMVEAVNRERLLGTPVTSGVKEEVYRFIENDIDDDLYQSLYGNILKMNLEKSAGEAVSYYHKVKTTLMAFRGSIPKEEVRTVCVYLQNFCLTLINKGDQKYLRELLDIIQFRISKEVLLEDGMINPQLFKNIVGTAIRLDEISWVTNFINNFKRYLPEGLKSDYYNLAVGQLFYHQREYEKSCKHLAMASHNKNDVYFGFTVKKLLLKIGYESEDIYLLAPFIATYRKHLERYRHKIGENAAILERFFKYFRMLVNARGDSEKMEILLNKLLTEDNFADKDWLVKMTTKGVKLSESYCIRTKKQISLQ